MTDQPQTTRNTHPRNNPDTAPFTAEEWATVQANDDLRMLAGHLAFDAPDTSTIGEIRAAVRQKMRDLS